MSQYIENNLGKGERIILKAKKSALYLLPGILWFLALIAAAIAVSIIKPWQPKTWEDMLMGQLMGSNEAVYLGITWGGALILGFLPFLSALLKYLSIDLAITNKRVIGKVGILRVNTVDIPIGKVDHVQVKAGVLGNLLHYYALRVLSAGGGGYDSRRAKKERFVGISNAQEFKNAVTEAIERHAEEARKAQAEEIAMAMGRRDQALADAINNKKGF